MRKLQTAAAMLALLLSPGGFSAAQDADLRAALTAPIAIERAAPVTSAPLENRGGVLFLNAAANGQSREFILDTGSPTILTREFADALGLHTIGQNTGVDANGAPLTMDIAVVESLTIGDTTFRNVPVLIFDFSGLAAGACLVDGGMLGSELLPGSAWRIDTEGGQLSIAETAAALGGSAPVVRARLYDFGYPHAPVVDYAVGEVTDKALFDTGNAEQVTLFAEVAQNRSVQAAFASGSVSRGRGTEGESAGGRGEVTDLIRFTLPRFEIDGQPIGPVRAATRGAPPTLVGLGMLRSHVVTLDYPGAQFLLESRSEPAPSRPEAGYSIAPDGDAARVVRLFEDSAAAHAGLRLGDRVIEAGGRSLRVAPEASRCDVVDWLMQSFDPTAAANLTVERDGAPVTIDIPATRP